MKKIIPPDEYYKGLPKKPMGAGVFLFDENNRLLIVKPNYKEGWSIPGGAVDANESPKEAAIRETKEEVGLEVNNLSLICVHYKRSEDARKESIRFIFYGGILSGDEIRKIVLEKDELDDFRFFEASGSSSLLGKNLQRRLPFCLEAIRNETTVYLEN